jgi:hypothetical protein
MMLHQDGSPHAWLVGQGPLDLVITLDDAPSAIDSAGLVEEQGTASSFLGLAETIAAHGLPCSLDTDRGSPYFHTPEAGGPVAKGTLTPVGRALAQLGIEPIPASSPEARGRCERAFRPLQDRLPKELARAGMTTIAAAHAFLHEVSLPAHTARFATKPAKEGSAFGLVAEAQWRDLLCIQEERTVAPDNPVSWNGRVCRSRLIRQEPLSSRPRCGSTTTRMALSPSSTDRAASFVGVPIGTQPTAALRQAAASAAFATSRPLWTAWTRLRLAQPAHNSNKQGGQPMCYINRTSSRARYSRSGGGARRRGDLEASLHTTPAPRSASDEGQQVAVERRTPLRQREVDGMKVQAPPTRDRSAFPKRLQLCIAASIDYLSSP